MRIQEAMGMGVPAGNAIGIAGSCTESFTATGSTSADAAVLTSANTLITAGAGSTGVRAPTDSQVGDCFVVGNGTGGSILVYPHTGGKINNGSTDAGKTVTTTKGMRMTRVGPTHWIATVE